MLNFIFLIIQCNCCIIIGRFNLGRSIDDCGNVTLSCEPPCVVQRYNKTLTEYDLKVSFVSFTAWREDVYKAEIVYWKTNNKTEVQTLSILDSTRPLDCYPLDVHKMYVYLKKNIDT